MHFVSRSIYIVGCLERRDEAHAAAEELIAWDWKVVSNWHDQDVSREKERALESRIDRFAISDENHRRLRVATHALYLADPRGRGSLVEIGVAIARGLPITAVGDYRDVTLMADRITTVWCPSISAALALLGVRSPTSSGPPRCAWHRGGCDRAAGMSGVLCTEHEDKSARYLASPRGVPCEAQCGRRATCIDRDGRYACFDCSAQTLRLEVLPAVAAETRSYDVVGVDREGGR